MCRRTGGKHQTQRAPGVVQTLAGAGTTDVDTTIMIKRWSLLRRAWHLRPQWKHQILQICELYQQTIANQNQPSQLEHLDQHDSTDPEYGDTDDDLIMHDEVAGGGVDSSSDVAGNGGGSSGIGSHALQPNKCRNHQGGIFPTTITNDQSYQTPLTTPKILLKKTNLSNATNFRKKTLGRSRCILEA